MTFINADEIAKILLNYPSPAADVEAGRILFQQWDTLAEQRANFAVETTLSSRALAVRVKKLQSVGYRFHLIYVWVPDVELSIARVASRVEQGGHHIPEDTIRRRYKAGLKNFFEVYEPIADEWEFCMNIRLGEPDIIARKTRGEGTKVLRPDIWDICHKEIENEKTD